MKVVGLVLAAGCMLALAPGAGADRPGSVVSRPHGFQLLINGKRLPSTPIDKDDGYHPVHFKTMKVTAKWIGTATGSGYFVRIRATEPKSHVYVRCSRGTTCAVPTAVRIRLHDEWEWILELMTVHGQRVVGGLQVCIVRGQ